MEFGVLRELLDGNPAARRRAPDQPVWDATYRLIDLPNRLRGSAPRDSDALLVQVLVALSESQRPLFLQTDDAFEVSDPAGEAWIQVSPGTMQARTVLSTAQLTESPLFTTYGNYSIYSRSEPLPDGLPSGPWWGSRRKPVSAADLLELLRSVGIDAVITVHADASNWVAAFP
jgi:hypothetical protein